MLKGPADGRAMWQNWAIKIRQNDSYAGFIETTIRQDKSIYLAYFIFVSHWRQGIAREGVRAVLAHLRAAYGAKEVIAEMDTRNLASIGLVESLGFKRTGKTGNADFFKGQASNEYRYRLALDEDQMITLDHLVVAARTLEEGTGKAIRLGSVQFGDADSQRQAVLDQFPELQGTRVFLFLGRIHEKKGCDLLIRAFAKTAGNIDSARLVIAGPDQTGWTKDLRALAERLNLSRNVLWTGMLSGDSKWGMLRLAEAFVLPSHQENFGIAVAEALACGTPVLISNKVNIWREIGQDRAGLVDDDDEPGTTRLLEKWLGMTPEAREAMRGDARRCFESRFEVTRAAAALVHVVGGTAAQARQ